MTFANEITISDVTSTVSIILVILGGIFGYYQWRKSVLLKRAGYINDLIEKIRTDEYIKDVVYMFDYNKKWYYESFNQSGELELKVDKTLSYFSYICYLKRQKIITDKEFDFFKYEVERILMNQQVQDYFIIYIIFLKNLKRHLPLNIYLNMGKKEKCLMMISMIKVRMKKAKNIIDI